jgi:hypothetical protein
MVAYKHITRANYAYYQMTLSYEKSYSLCADLLTRIDDLDDYPDDGKFAVFGNYSAKSGELEDIVPYITGVSQDIFLLTDYHYASLWSHCFGRELSTTDDSVKEEIKATAEYENMPVYPAKGSVAVIDDTIVIRLSED